MLTNEEGLFRIILEKSVKYEKDVQVIGLASVMKKCDVFAMDGVYAENAWSIFSATLLVFSMDAVISRVQEHKSLISTFFI